MGLAITSISTPPVTLAEVKSYLRIDGKEEDGLLTFLIDAATGHIEDQTRQQLGSTSLELTLDAFPASGEIRLPKPPLRMVDQIWYFNPAGQQQIVPSTSYTVDVTSKPGRINLKPGREWPETDGSAGCVRIEFTAGHDNAAAVPAVLRQAIKFLVGHWYEHREAASDRRIDNVPMTVQSILDLHTYREAA